MMNTVTHFTFSHQEYLELQDGKLCHYRLFSLTTVKSPPLVPESHLLVSDWLYASSVVHWSGSLAQFQHYLYRWLKQGVKFPNITQFSQGFPR